MIEDFRESLTEHRLNKWYYEAFQRDNPTLAGKVIAYLDDQGSRPTETELGANHYARGLVKAKDGLLKAEPPPTSDDFLWDAPILSSPVVRTINNASPSISKGTGQDLKIVFGEQLNRAIGQIEGYNDIVMEDFSIIGGTSFSQGHIVPRENTGTFFMKNGHLELLNHSDAITSRWRTPILRMVNLYIEVTCGVKDNNGKWIRPSSPHHSDGWQSQQAMHDELGFDRCTFVTDYQGIFQSNEVSTLAGQRSRINKTIISRTLFKPGKVGFPASWWFKTFPPRAGTDPVGVTEMYDVWAPLQNILGHVYPNGTTWRAWDGSNNKYGCFLEQKMHPKLNKMVPFARFSLTSDKVPAGKPLARQTCGDVGVRGDGGMWCYNTLADVPNYVGSMGV